MKKRRKPKPKLKPIVDRPHAQMYCGDMREVVPSLGKFTACVCDPPYGLGFMGKKWDHAVPGPEYWRVVLDAVKPGGMLLAFAGTRTWHRMACAIEDAGWEIRDTIMWLYSQGFPKSHDISKAIDKRGGHPELTREIGEALKHARERRKKTVGWCDRTFCNGTTNWSWFEGRPRGQRAPTPLTFSKIVKKWPELRKYADKIRELDREQIGIAVSGIGTAFGKGGWGGGSSEEYALTAPNSTNARRWNGYGTSLKPSWEPVIVAMKPLDGSFAENALEHGVAGVNIDGSRVGHQGGVRKINPDPSGAAFGGRGFGCNGTTEAIGGRWPANVILDEDAAKQLDRQSGFTRTRPTSDHITKTNCPTGNFVSGTKITRGSQISDAGGASRFFYTAKCSTSERNAGLERYEKNMHPTVKPVDLMRYLVKLVTMPSGTRILDPFAGSGSTLVACKQLGVDCVGVTLDAEDCKIADGRLSQRIGIKKRKKLRLGRRRAKRKGK